MTADQLKSLRKSLGLSINQLSRCIGSNERTIRLWEEGSKPVPKGIEVFLDVLSRFPEVVSYRLAESSKEGSLSGKTRVL